MHCEPVVSDDDIGKLAALAHDIWHGYWPALIGEAQTAYMVDAFQSAEAIRHAIHVEGYEYWFLFDGGEGEGGSGGGGGYTGGRGDGDVLRGRLVGYTGGRAEPQGGRFFLSKLYLHEAERGRGFATGALRFYEQLCQKRGLHTLYLTVNKHNDLAIRAYRAKGFKTTDAVKTDIGGGFFMDDYIMEKHIGPPAKTL